MMKLLNRFRLPIIFILIVWTASNLKWGGDFWKEIILVDGKGYYAHLPATFIYDDLSFSFHPSIEYQYYTKNNYYDYRFIHEGDTVNRYFSGVAVAQLPFFLIAHGFTQFTTHPTDGYSKLYSIFVHVATIFYLIIGLFYLSKIFYHYKFSETTITILLFGIVFGTNVFYYTNGEPSMSHVYSLAFVSLFIWNTFQLLQTKSHKYYLILAALFGIIVLIRPVNGIIIFALPFLVGHWKNFQWFIRSLFQKPLILIGSLLIFGSIISIQFGIYYLQTGQIWVYSYPEFFEWLDPNFLDFLFSYKKGLFVYLPITFVSLFGSYFLYQKNQYQFWSIFLFLILVFYVLSAWEIWWYGGSFGMRPFIEFLPFSMVLLGFLLEGVKGKKSDGWIKGLVIALVLICQIQTYQYRYGQIHFEDMTKEKYWEVFMRIDKLL